MLTKSLEATGAEYNRNSLEKPLGKESKSEWDFWSHKERRDVRIKPEM